jgi:hypothetical protein
MKRQQRYRQPEYENELTIFGNHSFVPREKKYFGTDVMILKIYSPKNRRVLRETLLNPAKSGL